MDIFVKKYQPDKYDAWLLAYQNSLVEKRKRNNTTQQASENVPNRMLNNQTFKNYLLKISAHYLNADRNSLSTHTHPQSKQQNKIRSAQVAKLAEFLSERDLALFVKNCVKLGENLQNLAGLSAHVLLALTSPAKNQKKAGRYIISHTNDLPLTLKKTLPSDQAIHSVTQQRSLEQNRKAQVENKKCENTFMTIHVKHTSEFSEKTNGLWSFQTLSEPELSENVCKFNEAQSLEYPHCAICLPFKLESRSLSELDDSKSDKSSMLARSAINSEILVPEMCFSKRSRARNIIDVNAGKSDNIDCILQCKRCKLTVHQSKNLNQTFKDLYPNFIRNHTKIKIINFNKQS